MAASHREIAVRLVGVTKVYPMGALQVQALQGVDLAILQGEFVVILGPSGSGKTTILNLMGGLDSPSGGRIFTDGAEITALTVGQLTRYRREKVGFIFQFFNLIPTLTAQENVELAAELVSRPLAVGPLLAELGLGERLRHFPSELSGGEQQRVAIARALVTDPPLVLCDEPSGILDYETGKRIFALMKGICRQRGKTFVVVTHNAALGQIAHRVIQLRDGRVVRDEVNPHPLEAEALRW
ncbi:MAG: ABC transporter ATP-binding protein [Chloroflexi bacterium]|nr:ABC transporter ATP-binding protein [Chloroflexota bacterium]